MKKKQKRIVLICLFVCLLLPFVLLFVISIPNRLKFEPAKSVAIEYLEDKYNEQMVYVTGSTSPESEFVFSFHPVEKPKVIYTVYVSGKDELKVWKEGWTVLRDDGSNVRYISPNIEDESVFSH